MRLTPERRSAASEPAVVAVLSASMLPTGDYRLRLTGQSEGGDPEPVATYFLPVHGQ